MLDKWCELVDRVIKEKKKEADEYIKKYIDPIAEIGNPEKIINKPYNSWTPEDIAALKGIYVYSPEKLEHFINRKEVDKLFALMEVNKRLEI